MARSSSRSPKYLIASTAQSKTALSPSTAVVVDQGCCQAPFQIGFADAAGQGYLVAYSSLVHLVHSVVSHRYDGTASRYCKPLVNVLHHSTCTFLRQQACMATKALRQARIARVLLVTMYHLSGPGDTKCYFPTWVGLLGPGHTK